MQDYPIGTPGQPWNDTEKQQWYSNQTIKRSYKEEVLHRLHATTFEDYEVVKYGALPYDEARYPLYAVVPKQYQSSLFTVLVTGGVHGYETSGVQGALDFIENQLAEYKDKFNFVIVPCVSPWGYETINRWDPLTLDPNRNFKKDSGAPEALLLWQFLHSVPEPFHVHIDLHETTDTDNSEFRPALAARDGENQDRWSIPDGFYLVADSNNVQPAFQKAIIDSVRKVTHIAPADEQGKIIGADIISEGVISYDKKSLSLCGGMTDAPYVSTTEVYPDSPSATPDVCNQAQVAAVKGALEFVLGQHADEFS